MATFLSPSETIPKGAKTLPGRYFTSQEIYRQETERIFQERWVLVGRQEQVPSPGDFFLRQIGDESIIVLRDKAGEKRAFYNVCRHRGTRLCVEDEGRFKSSIQCPYHAWTYSLDGELVGAPLMDEDERQGFNKADYPLVPAALAEWEGFLFLNLSERPQPFEAANEALIGKFAQWHLPELLAARRIEYDVRANWKLIVQNYSECYHCPLIHPDLSRISPFQSGKNDLYAGPILGGYMEIDHQAESLTVSGRACALPIGEVSGEDLKRVYYYSIFPNTLLSLHPDYVMVHTLKPQAPDRTQITCEWLFHPEAMAQPDFNPDDAVAFWDTTNRQDWEVCELSQLGVGSRAYTPAPYSGREGLLAAFDQEVLEALGH